jgi:hypothetical protein
MDNLLPVGTLVRVLESALNDDRQWGALNAKQVDRNGRLYLVLGWSSANKLYECKSLATGDDNRIFWFPREIEAAPQEED